MANAPTAVTRLALAMLVLLAAAACDSGGIARDLSAAAADLAAPIHAGDGGGGVACGAGDCPVGGDQVCCRATATSYCAPVAACSGRPAYCDGPEDCDGALCCLARGATAVVCRQPCDGATLCHSDGDCPPAQPRCCPDAASGYRACAAGC